MIWPAVDCGVTFSSMGITLALIRRQLKELDKKLDLILEKDRKVALDKLSEAMISLENRNHEAARDNFQRYLWGFHLKVLIKKKDLLKSKRQLDSFLSPASSFKTEQWTRPMRDFINAGTIWLDCSARKSDSFACSWSKHMNQIIWAVEVECFYPSFMCQNR